MKIYNCDNCSPESIFDAKHDDNGNPIWECRCCGNKIERKVYNTKKKQERKEKLAKINSTIEKLMAD